MYAPTDTTQVTKFLQLLDISEKSQDLTGWGWEGHPKISFSVILKMIGLSNDDQDKILQTIKENGKEKKLTQNDIQKIKDCRNENLDTPIEKCIEKILKLKAATAIRNLVVCEIHEKLGDFIKLNDDYEIKIIDMLKSDLDGEFYQIDTTDILITISMDKTAFKIFREQQSEKNVSYSDFLNLFLEKHFV